MLRRRSIILLTRREILPAEFYRFIFPEFNLVELAKYMPPKADPKAKDKGGAAKGERVKLPAPAPVVPVVPRLKGCSR